jgi:hypothetical protein
LSHPRVFLRDTDIPEVKLRIKNDHYAAAVYVKLQTRADNLLKSPTNKYILHDQILLATSRDIENRVLTLALLYRLSDKKQYADRAIAEMLTAASFPDWFPGHFLDAAEMTSALAIGYDWLFTALSPDEKKVIKAALINKGINPWLEVLRARKFNLRNNWVQVCYGSVVLGALAITEKNDQADIARSQEVLSYARPAMADIMKLFAPDGGFEEGPTYWNYANTYNAIYIASLDSTLGSDFGAAGAEGFSDTGAYHLQSIGPTFLLANFGDSQPYSFPSAVMYWFSREFKQPSYALQERQIEEAVTGHLAPEARAESDRFDALGLVWYSLTPETSDIKYLPLVQAFVRIAQVYLRSAWDDRMAWYIGFKGGSAQASHGHLDLGSFVMDAYGERWAIDLGLDNYSLPGYFGKERWNYYRTRTQGHNTLTINDQNEDLDAAASVMRTGNSTTSRLAILNLDSAYKHTLQSWKRGVAILDGEKVLVQDEINLPSAADIVWHLHTRASVQVAADGTTALLTQGGKSLTVRVISPAGGKLAATSIRPDLPQASNVGVTDLQLRHPGLTGQVTIGVLFAKSSADNVNLKPLKDW